MEAGELNNGLGHLDIGAVHFLVIGGQRQSAINHDLASFGDGLEHSFAQAIGDRCQLQPIKTVVESNLR